MRSQPGPDRSGPTALVANLQRMSTEDGPGIRTTVFLKGCSLACSWCHNPECLSGHPQVLWNGVRCIGCANCEEICPVSAPECGPAGVSIDRERCQGCGTCAEACPTTAMELFGTRWSVDALVAEVAKDRCYFASSGGGVTVSGGEPVLQAPFVEAFLGRCRSLDISTALDTCGLCQTDALLGLARMADLILYDLKVMDPGQHAALTGKPNQKILRNLLAVRDYLASHDHSPSLWIRTPLVPGATATPENIHAIGEFIAGELGDLVARWELCAFNNLCRDKYSRLGIEWAFSHCELLPAASLKRFKRIAEGSGVDPGIVVATGATRANGARDASRPSEETPCWTGSPTLRGME